MSRTRVLRSLFAPITAWPVGVLCARGARQLAWLTLPLALTVGVISMAAAEPAASAKSTTADAAIAADPEARARKTYIEKRALAHPAIIDTPAERSASYVASLRAPIAPGAPAAASIADGNAQLAYVRREHATANSRGVVVLFDDRERLPATSAMLGRVAENLALRGWDTWTLALPQVGPPAPLPRDRSHALIPPPSADGEGDSGASLQKSKGKAPTPAHGPQLSRRRWALPAPNAKTLPAPPTLAWQAVAQQRMALLMQAAQAAQASGSGGGPSPVVLIGAGLAANLAAHQMLAERWNIAAAVLIDLIAAPTELTLPLDSDLAAIAAPNLAITWRAADPVAPGTWLRAQHEARRDLSAATAAEVGQVVGGWLDRQLGGPR